MRGKQQTIELAKRWGPLITPPAQYSPEFLAKLREVYEYNPAYALQMDDRGELLPKCKQCLEPQFRSQLMEDGRCKECQPYAEDFDTWSWRYHQYMPDGETCLVYFEQKRTKFGPCKFSKRWGGDPTSRLIVTPPCLMKVKLIGIIEVTSFIKPETTGRIILTTIKDAWCCIPVFHPTLDYLSIYAFHEPLTETTEVTDWKEHLTPPPVTK